MKEINQMKKKILLIEEYQNKIKFAENNFKRDKRFYLLISKLNKTINNLKNNIISLDFETFNEITKNKDKINSGFGGFHYQKFLIEEIYSEIYKTNKYKKESIYGIIAVCETTSIFSKYYLHFGNITIIK